MVRFALESVHGDDGWLPAVRMGDPWNGYATPVVTPATMATLAREMSDAAERWQWDDDAFDVFTRDGDVWVMSREGEDDVTRIEPDADGNYDLSVLGYTFMEVDEPGVPCEVCGRPATDSVCDVNGMPDGVQVWVDACDDDACRNAVTGHDDDDDDGGDDNDAIDRAADALRAAGVADIVGTLLDIMDDDDVAGMRMESEVPAARRLEAALARKGSAPAVRMYRMTNGAVVTSHAMTADGEVTRHREIRQGDAILGWFYGAREGLFYAETRLGRPVIERSEHAAVMAVYSWA